jgi:antitoxin component YwqK of YwqJK toxin-antitoxin module
MKASIIILSFFVVFNTFGQKQPDSLGFKNKKEAKNRKVNGKKEGKWIEYYTDEDEADNIHPTNDSSIAASYVLVIYRNDKAEGIVRNYWKNGKLSAEIQYKNGSRNGFERDYADDGTVILEAMFVNDRLNGPYIEYAGKNKREELNYVNDQQTGIKKEYYDDGHLKSEVNLVEGSRNGIEKTYYENGKLASESVYSNDKLTGTVNFDENGNEIK